MADWKNDLQIHEAGQERQNYKERPHAGPGQETKWKIQVQFLPSFLDPLASPP
jgi:hypothetical protein